MGAGNGRAEEGLFDAGRAALSIGIVISISLIAVEAMAVATIMPVVAQDFEVLGGYGWAFSAFMLANVVGTVATGPAADARGPGTPFVIGLICAAAGLLVAAASTSWGMFIAGRILQGLGGGVLMTTGYLVVRLGFPPALRARAMALISSSWVIPALLAPAAAGIVGDLFGWRFVFLGLLPLLVAIPFLMLRALRTLGSPTGAPLEGLTTFRALRLSAGLGLFLYGIGEGSLLGIILLFLGFFLAVDAARHLLPQGIFTAKAGLPAGLVTRGLLSFCYFGAEAFLPLGLTALRGLSPTGAGIALSAAALSWTAGSLIQSRIDDIYGPGTRGGRVLGGFIGMVAGTSLMAIGVLSSSIPIAFIVVCWALGALGMGLVYPTLSLIVLELAPAGEEGRTSSSLNLAENIGIALGTGLAGAALGWSQRIGWSEHDGIAASYLVVILPGIFGIFIATRIGLSRQKKREEPG